MLTTTPGVGEGFEYTTQGDRLTVAAPATNTSGNLRAVFFGADAPESRDQQVCMDWPTPDGRAQPGIALRIRPPTADEPVRAIVLDQNIWDDVLWSIHVLLFDGTTTGELSNLTSLATFEMLDTFYATDAVPADVVPERRPGPWHVCARVAGSTLRFKAWVRDAPEPSWSDSTHARSVELPAEWVYSGHPGGYVAHVHPGRSLDFDNVMSRELSRGS